MQTRRALTSHCCSDLPLPVSLLFCRAVKRRRSPVPERAVFEPRDRQVSRVVRIARREFFVDIHAVTGRLARMHRAPIEGPRMRENIERFLRETHVFLHAEIRYPEVE